MRLILILFLLLSSGCSTPQWEINKNTSNLSKLIIGMTNEEVLTIMGTPRLTETHETLNDEPVFICFYYTKKRWTYYSYTKEDMTPVVIEGGRLVGWGDEFYKNRAETYKQ